MCQILLSIKPKHVENILNGTKKYEYRKYPCKQKPDKILIYSTSPVKKIVGEVAVLDIIRLQKDQLWEITKEHGAINEKDFKTYYNNTDIAIAYKLGEVTEYDKYKEISEFGLKQPPQSFIYI